MVNQTASSCKISKKIGDAVKRSSFNRPQWKQNILIVQQAPKSRSEAYNERKSDEIFYNETKFLEILEMKKSEDHMSKDKRIE
jgi:hypothetical protein